MRVRTWVGLGVAVTVMSALAGTPAHASAPTRAARFVPRIANGETAAQGKYDFAVKLTMTGLPTADGGSRDSSCSGGLISPSWVLTAGHCFKDVNGKHVARPVADRTTATIGRADLRTRAGHVVEIVAVRQSGTADVALAKLKTPVTDIRPMVLSAKPPKRNAKVRLTGFGLTDGDESSIAERMQTGQFLVTTVAKTTIGMAGTAPRSSTSPCPHDSGGPYFTQAADGTATVVSVVSNGPTCPHTGADLSGRIDNITGWIYGIIGKPSKPRPSPSTTTAPNRAAAARSSAPVAAAPPPGLLQTPGLPVVGAGAALIAVIAGTTMLTARSRRRRRAYNTRGVRRHSRH
ncbi:S1 family peptidase [Actinoplanes sp. NPDC051494]|uniref:S1 family peptidase n=1 Tax=Actinoplanes sp. NPDC051494 TaxID=3363907 RepID=UPI0037B20701